MKHLLENDYPESPPSIEECVDALFAKILQCSPCTVEAEMRSGDSSIQWKRIDAADEIIWECSARHFRSVLARIGFHYIQGQVHEGFGIAEVRFKDESHQVRIYLGNNALTGYWTRIYAGSGAQASTEEVHQTK
jgi:hypothetical protein